MRTDPEREGHSSRPDCALGEQPNVFVALDAIQCSNRCRHCFLTHGPRRRHLSRQEIRAWRDRVQEAASKAGLAAQFHVERTELLDHPEWRGILADEGDESLSRGWATNGHQMARDPRLIEECRARGVEWLQFTLAGPDARTHDAFTRRSGSFDEVLRAAEHAQRAGLQVQWVYLAYRPLSLVARTSALTNALFGPDVDEQLFLIKPQAAGVAMEQRRPRKADLGELPEALRSRFSTWGGAGCETEGDLVRGLSSGERVLGCIERKEAVGWVKLALCRNGDLYPACHERTRDYLLGNILDNGLEAPVRRALGEDPPAGVAARLHGLPRLAVDHGNPDGDKLHSGCSLCRTLVGRVLRATVAG